MKSKISFVFPLLFLFAITCFGQDDMYRTFLNRTSVAIHKAQKTMMATGKTDAGGKLANAVLLQSHAIKLYQQKKQTLAACSSAQARELAALIIKELNGKVDAFFQLTDDEKKLLSGCADEKELLKEGKNSLKELSMKTDKDYASPTS